MAMKNALNSIPFYKSKSIMIIEPAMTVNYGVASILIQFKFAARADNKAKGEWNEANAFYLTSFSDLYNLTNGLNQLISNKVDKVEFKNPMKKTALQIRYSAADDGRVFIVFHFFNDQYKVNTPLTIDEATPLFAYFKNLIENYNTVAATALLRNDIWYDLYGKNSSKESKGNANQNGNGYKNTKPDNRQSQQTQSNQSSVMDDIERELNSMSGGNDTLSNNFDSDDVPF
jgi:hypothetical protein